MEDFFASCPRGLESLLVDDLLHAGARECRAIPGGAHFVGDWPACYRANLESRIATRVLWRVAQGAYATEEDIYRLALDTPWPRWFAADQTLRVDLDAKNSPLKSLDFVTLRIKDAICDRFRRELGVRPSVDTRSPDVRVQAFIDRHGCTLYLDTSGAPLYQRGYRQKTVDAPLKENLAAGILRLTGWEPGIALLDPMCGSGTFLLEAAQMVLGVAPGARRSFAFQRLRNFSSASWQEILDRARSTERSAGEVRVFGSDASPVAVRAALANLDRGRLLSAVQLRTADVREAEAPAPTGILVANPPYGERVADRDELASFYPALGTALKRHFAGWRCYLFSADSRLPGLLRLTPARKTPLFNGALDCRLYEFRMVAGSNRRPTATANPG